MKKILTIGILMCIFSVFSSAQEITVVKGTNDYTPYEMHLGNHQYAGIYVDIVVEVFRKLGIKAKIKEFPWARCIKYMKEGKYEAIFAPFINPERETFMYFPDEPLAREETVLYTYKGSGITFSGNLEQLKKYKIAVLRGASYGEAWDKIAFPKLQKVDTQNSLVEMLAKKRIQLIVGTRYVLQYTAKQNQVTHQITNLEPPLSIDGGYIAFSKAKGPAQKEMADAFSQELKKLKASTQYQAILEKYISSGS